MAQLQDLFQTHAVVKILDFLTLYKEFEYTRTDIANETGISRRTLYQVWPTLERFDLVKVTKSSGKIRFYKLNTENPISKQLVGLTDKISFFEAEKIAGVEAIPILQSNLPTYISSSEEKKSVKITRKFIMLEQTVEGTPSEIEELFKEVPQLKNGKLTFSILASTESETVGRKKKKTLRISSTSHSDGTPLTLVKAE